MADSRVIIMKVKMRFSSVSLYLFVLSLLNVGVKSQIPSDGNSHIFIREHRGQEIDEQIQITVHNEAPVGTYRYQNSEFMIIKSGPSEDADKGGGEGGSLYQHTFSAHGFSEAALSYHMQGIRDAIGMITTDMTKIRVQPPSIDFGKRTLCGAHLETVTISNVHKNKSIEMSYLMSKNNVFKANSYKERFIRPMSNITFDIVFLSPKEGYKEGTIFVHTSAGNFKYHVRAESVACPYRIRPLMGIRLPLNAWYRNDITIHNPYGATLLLSDAEVEDEDLGIEVVLLGQKKVINGKEFWMVPKFMTVPFLKIRYHANTSGNFSTYIKIKMANVENDEIFIPIEIEVLATPGLYCPNGILDFGFGTSMDEPRKIPVVVANSKANALYWAQNVWASPNKSISVKMMREEIKVLPKNAGTNKTTDLTFNWKTVKKSGVYSGVITVKTRYNSISIPYRVEVMVGELAYDKSSLSFSSEDEVLKTKRLYMTNKFDRLVVVTNVTNRFDQNNVLLASVFANFRYNFTLPVLLEPNEQKPIVDITPNNGFRLPPNINMRWHLYIDTNATTVVVPVYYYDGRLTAVDYKYQGGKTVINFNIVDNRRSSQMSIGLVNTNPIDIEVLGFGADNETTKVELLTVIPGDENYYLNYFNPFDSELENSKYSENEEAIMIKSDHIAVLSITILSEFDTERVSSSVWIKTPYETIILNKSLEVHTGGEFNVDSRLFVFQECFPGQRCLVPLSVKSSFSEGMTVVNASLLMPDSKFEFITSNLTVAPDTMTLIGHLSWQPRKCYTHVVEVSEPGAYRTISLNDGTGISDAKLLTECYNTFTNNLTRPIDVWVRAVTVDKEMVEFVAAIKVAWPRIIRTNRVMYPLTQIGSLSKKDLVITNSNADWSILVNVILATNYPSAKEVIDNMPARLRPACEECKKSLNISDDFFIIKTNEKNDPSFESFEYLQAYSFLVPPLTNLSFSVGFIPTSTNRSTSFVFIRNNLTVLEVVKLTGVGASVNFKLGNPKPVHNSALYFQMTPRHIEDCKRRKNDRVSVPHISINRSFTAQNFGPLPIKVGGFHINGQPCKGFGFEVLNCKPFNLMPNMSRKIDIVFTPDFTLLNVHRTLSIFMNDDTAAANYSMVATIESEVINACYALLMRNKGEFYLQYTALLGMVVMLLFVVGFACCDSYKILEKRPCTQFFHLSLAQEERVPCTNKCNISQKCEDKQSKDLSAVDSEETRESKLFCCCGNDSNVNTDSKHDNDSLFTTFDNCSYSNNSNMMESSSDSSRLSGDNDASSPNDSSSWTSIFASKPGNSSSTNDQTNATNNNNNNNNSNILDNNTNNASHAKQISNNGCIIKNISSAEIKMDTCQNQSQTTTSCSISKSTNESTKTSSVPYVPLMRPTDLTSNLRKNKYTVNSSSLSSVSSSNNNNNKNKNGNGRLNKKVVTTTTMLPSVAKSTNVVTSCQDPIITDADSLKNSCTTHDTSDKVKSTKKIPESKSSKSSITNTNKCSNKQSRNNNNVTKNNNKKTENNNVEKMQERSVKNQSTMCSLDKEEEGEKCVATKQFLTSSASNTEPVGNMLPISPSSSVSSISTSSGYSSQSNSKPQSCRNAKKTFKNKEIPNSVEVNKQQPQNLTTYSSNNNSIGKENLKTVGIGCPTNINGNLNLKTADSVTSMSNNKMRAKDKRKMISAEKNSQSLLGTPNLEKVATNQVLPLPSTVSKASFSDVVARASSTSSTTHDNKPVTTSSSSPHCFTMSPVSTFNSVESYNSLSSIVSNLGPIGSKISTGRPKTNTEPKQPAKDFTFKSNPPPVQPPNKIPSLYGFDAGLPSTESSSSSSSHLQNNLLNQQLCSGATSGLWLTSETDDRKLATNVYEGGMASEYNNFFGSDQNSKPKESSWPPPENPIWEPSTAFYTPSSAKLPDPELPTKSSNGAIWSCDVWAPPTAPWAPPGLAPRPPPIPSAPLSDLDFDYHTFHSLSNIWSPPSTPTRNIWLPPTSK